MDHDVAHFTFELEHGNTNKMTCAISDDSGLSGHPPSLIRVFVVRCIGSYCPKLPSVGQRRLWPDWADLSLRWAHMSFVGFVLLRIILLLKQPRYSWLQAHRMNIVAFEFHSFVWVHCNWIKYQMIPLPRNENKNTATPDQYDKIFEI